MRDDRGRKQREVVDGLIQKAEERLLGDGEMKATLGDYIRLIQIRMEMEADEPRDIEVRWVDPESKDSNQ